MKNILLILFLLPMCFCFAQVDSLNIVEKLEELIKTVDTIDEQVESNRDRIEFQQRDYNSLDQEILKLQDFLDELEKSNQEIQKNIDGILAKLKTNIDDMEAKLQTKTDSILAVISEMENNTNNIFESINGSLGVTNQKNTEKFDLLNQTLKKRIQYTIIALVIILAVIILTYLITKKALYKQNSELSSSIAKTRSIMEKESIQLDSKLIEILEKQMVIQQESFSKGNKEEFDHSLTLKVADEIIRIEKNLSRMDEKIKGYKQLKAAVNRIKDNFAAKGYDIIDMIGMDYDTGMKVIANFIPDETLEKDQQIITRIIRPQVNYEGIMIQSAQIEVSQGE